jgi:VanZ family protein
MHGAIVNIVASVMSEYVQALLPSKTFQLGDILANIAGTLAALWVAWYRYLQQRHRSERSALYLPLELQGNVPQTP